MPKLSHPPTPAGVTLPAQDLPDSYEAALQELDALVNRLDSGQLPLDDLLTQYQRGAALLAFCRSKLQAVEQQIQVLENGELKPWGGGRMSWDFAAWSERGLCAVEAALSAWVPANAPAGLGAAMRYAVLDGGKRLRPLLALAAAEAVLPAGQSLPTGTLRVACAVELIHAYSLVHDDMPCMDDDVLRRGKPTVHVQFGQAEALLAGDALQALAFEVLVPPVPEDSAPQLTVELCRQLARAAGYAGMAGGQAIDLAGVGQRLTQAQLEEMHCLKTGALLLGSVNMGAVSVGATPQQLAALTRYGQALGLAFQVVDDVLDVTADTATLGKTPGKDAAADKPTFVSLMGLQAAQAYANRLLNEALGALEQAPFTQTDALRAIALWVVRRNH